MPEPPDDFDDEQLRDALEDLAGEAAPPAKAPPGVLASARRRVARNSAVLAVAVVLVVGGVVAGYGLTGGNGSTPVPIGSLTGPSPVPTSAPSTTIPPTSAPVTSTPSPIPAPSFAPWTRPNDTMLFVDGVVYRFFPGGPQPAVVGIVPDDTAVQPPVSTPYGVVVLGGRAGRETHLWLIPAGGGQARLLASHTDGFAISADGKWVAYATLNENSTASVMRIRPLSPCCTVSIKTNTPVDAYVHVVGFIGMDLLVSTGDGAAASAAVWSESQRSLQRLDGYGSAIATDPTRGFAVLTEGDGRCWVIVPIVSSGSGGHMGSGKQAGHGCGILQASFQSNGQAVSGILTTSPDRTAPTTFVLQGTTSQLGGEAGVDGAFQTLWKGSDAGAPVILVMTEPTPDTVALVECRVSENLCASKPFWTATGAGDPGTAWLVEERPASR